ncbi:MAG: DUF3375 domain-containing protein [Terrimonas sp.]|nr:DUF3375 domain-containing protein [Terrimonas sp.]
MTSEHIAFLIQSSPALQMLRLRNAGWVLPFLYTAFKEHRKMVIKEEQLVPMLAETLSSHADGTEDLEEARIEFGEDEESRSRKYLLNWVQKRILQDFPDTDGNTNYQLSAYTEKVFQWMQNLQTGQHHVGTESRFKMLFASLRDMVENTEDDREKKLQILKDRRADIDKEIKAIELGVAPQRYNNAQVQERLDLFVKLCYELIGDFREVEDNFKQIHRSIVEQHTKAEQNKGAIVGFAFESYDALRSSNQGKSFYAFWDFLISRNGQEDWRNLTEQLLLLLEDRGLESDTNFLQNIKSFLLEQGKSVYDANDKMAEKLSRIITEKEIARHRRLRQQISSIKELVFDLMDEETIDAGLVVEEAAEIKITMDRKLMLEEKKTAGALKQPVAAIEKIADVERFNRLLNASFIDKKLLWEKVEQVLQHRQTATLKEIIEATSLDNGLAEVISYYSFLKEKAKRVQVIGSAVELIPLNKEATRFVEVPYLLFSK